MDKWYEKGESQPFWLSLLRQVFGIKEPEKYIKFEEQVKLDHTNFIDAYIPQTRVLIEQKGRKETFENLPDRQTVLSLLHLNKLNDTALNYHFQNTRAG